PNPEPEGIYFYLSRAHADRDHHHADPDFWINQVFADLCTMVERDRKALPGWRTGFLDPCAPDADHEDTTHRALAVAEVFVALYSVRYLTDARPIAQRTRFQSRFANEPEELAEPHVLPVLWEPTAEPARIPEFREAIGVAPDLREYTELGLAGLRRLASYRDTYDRLLGVLSRWIVDVAEGSPVAKRAAGAAASVVTPRTPPSFVVAVLAPRHGDLPRGRKAERYGPRPVDWRPFGAIQPMPVARHVAVRSPTHDVARVMDYEPGQDPFAASPGILLIDPWVIAAPNGRTMLIQALDQLPMWAQPVVLADLNDPQYYERGIQLVDDATDLCSLRRPSASQRRDVRGMEAFDFVIPYWLQLAYRRFRDRGARRPARTFSRRPRLGDPPIDDEQEWRHD
ncbi:MAG TPA: FxsC protein, partial [Micromonosporaceae bacterium]